MGYVEHCCPNCAAPLPSADTRVAVRCDYCAILLTYEMRGWRPKEQDDEAPTDPERPRFWLGGVRYALLGRLARGDSADVFLARREGRAPALCVVKALRAASDRDLLERESQVLVALQESPARGTPHFSLLAPQPVAHGVARLGMHGTEGAALVTVTRWRSGFVHNFEDIAVQYPRGVPPAAAVWLWKRVLEFLAWLNEAGWVHGAVIPAHLLVHARDHGVALVGWCAAVRSAARAPLPALSERALVWYPDAARRGEPVGPEVDVAMSARCVLGLLGADPELLRAPDGVPRPLAEVLERHADPGIRSDAWTVRERLDEAARQVFGPPKFVPFPMPGWA